MNPQFPIYIPSKSRASTATTPRVLAEMGVPFRIVVEAEQHDAYARAFGADCLLVLPPSYIEEYDPCWPIEEGASKGSGPARNFIWDHSISEGATHHWIIDDNISLFARFHQNRKRRLGDGSGFAAMEDFTLRYKNVGMAGPHYWMFVPSRVKAPPFIIGSRIYSCILIRNDLPFRWRGRYNEDTDLSLRVLKTGYWQTILFYAFPALKAPTQSLGGGNTEAFYAAEGTGPKSQMLVNLHPDVANISMKFGRVHHHINYRQFDHALLKRDDYVPPPVNPYDRLTLRPPDPDPAQP